MQRRRRAGLRGFHRAIIAKRRGEGTICPARRRNGGARPGEKRIRFNNLKTARLRLSIPEPSCIHEARNQVQDDRLVDGPHPFRNSQVQRLQGGAHRPVAHAQETQAVGMPADPGPVPPRDPDSLCPNLYCHSHAS